MTRPAPHSEPALAARSHVRKRLTGLRYVLAFAIVAVAYFGLAKLGLLLASVNPSASPIWPATGLALAAILLGGYRMWPAVFVAAVAVNFTTAGSTATSLAIALGNTLEALVTANLIRRTPSGRPDFNSPSGVVQFVALSLAPGALISATVGAASLAFVGLAEMDRFGPIWLTWWLGDAAGALMIAPVVLLWAQAPPRAFRSSQLIETAVVIAATVLVGTIAFSPLLEREAIRGPLSFLPILPLILAALRRGPRDTATVALILSGVAVWGTLRNDGPFVTSTLNDSFLLLLAFIVSITVPSLVLAADVTMRKRITESLHAARKTLDRQVQQRTSDLARAVQ
ncbi:MAG: MASE1 domain-containing protein, partial [Bradyrhizobium sp.]